MVNKVIAKFRWNRPPPNKIIFVIIGIGIVIGIGGFFGYLYLEDQQRQLQYKLDAEQKKTQQLESQKQKEELQAQQTQQQLQQQANQKQTEIAQQQSIIQQQQLQKAQQDIANFKQQQVSQQQLQQQQQVAQQQAQQAAQVQAQQQQQLQQQQQAAQQQAQQAAIQQEKDNYIAQAQTSALITGIIKGYLNIYIDPLPYYADPSVANAVTNIETALDGKTQLGILTHIVSDINQADIRIQWVKDYGPNPLGETIFGKQIEVGLGASSCGSWEPFNSWTVEHIMWHELGHTFGYAHSSDPNNVMYATTPAQFVRDTDVNDFLANGYYYQLYFCHPGTNFFQISTDNQNAGFDTYVAPPNTNPMDVINGKVPYYVSCSRNNMISYSNTCTVASGSYLIVNNPDRILGGNNQNIHVTITEENTRPDFNMVWDPAVWTMTQQEYDQIWSLFHNSQ